MKKLKLAVAAVMAVSALTMGSCSKSDDTANAAVVPGDETTTNTRYVNLARVFENYTLAREINDELQRLDLEFGNQAQAKQNELQRKAQNIQQKRDNNIYLSQQSFEADVNAYSRSEQEVQQWYNTRQMQLLQYSQSQSERLNDSIRNVVRDISLANNFDAVLNDTVAALYVNPALDITDAVIAELNKRYTPVAAPAPAAEPEKK